MPNQRSKDKVYLGGFVEKELHLMLVRFARQAGMKDNKFGVATQLLREGLELRKPRRRRRTVRPAHSRPKPASRRNLPASGGR